MAYFPELIQLLAIKCSLLIYYYPCEMLSINVLLSINLLLSINVLLPIRYIVTTYGDLIILFLPMNIIGIFHARKESFYLESLLGLNVKVDDSAGLGERDKTFHLNIIFN